MDPVIPFGSGDGISNLWCPDRAESVTERTSRFYTANSCKHEVTLTKLYTTVIPADTHLQKANYYTSLNRADG